MNELFTKIQNIFKNPTSNQITMLNSDEYEASEPKVLAGDIAKLPEDEDACHESNDPRLKFELLVE